MCVTVETVKSGRLTLGVFLLLLLLFWFLPGAFGFCMEQGEHVKTYLKIQKQTIKKTRKNTKTNKMRLYKKAWHLCQDMFGSQCTIDFPLTLRLLVLIKHSTPQSSPKVISNKGERLFNKAQMI